MIKKILVPLDGSKNSYRGLDEAINLARQCKATVIGIHVKDVPGIYALHPIGFIGLALGKEAKKVIEHAKTVCAKKGILFHGKILGGDPPYDIVRFAHNKRNKISNPRMWKKTWAICSQKEKSGRRNKKKKLY